MALQSERLAIGVIAAVVLLLVFLYSIFIQRAPLQIVGLILPALFLYLFWRFVRAHERIATSLESGRFEGSQESVEE